MGKYSERIANYISTTQTAESRRMVIINDGELLTKVNVYQYQRKDRSYKIEVHEVIHGADVAFIAIPVDALGMKTKVEEMRVHGQTAHEALSELLSRMQGRSVEEIIKA